MDLGKAGQSHNEWKVKFRVAISKKDTVDATTIAADNCCELGRWLHGDARKHVALKEYTDCRVKHANFHKEAGKIARLINDGRFAEAQASIAAGTPFATASYETVGAIGHLQKAIE